jgi:hypothetical protein
MIFINLETTIGGQSGRRSGEKKRQIKVAEYPRSGKEDRIYSLEASKYSLLPAGSAFMDFLPGVQPAGQTEIEK